MAMYLVVNFELDSIKPSTDAAALKKQQQTNEESNCKVISLKMKPPLTLNSVIH